MKSLIRKPMFALVALSMVVAACTLPLAPTPTPFVFPTPNLTLTALFMIPATSTPAPTGVGTAGPTSTSAAACTGTNLADFVSETIPDGSSITPGAAFTKTWTLKNIGTCTWTTGYSLVFDSGSQMSAPASVPLTAPVAPGASVTLSVNMVAPTTAGGYQGFWKLSTPQGARFGIGTGGTQAFWVKIFSGAAPTSVPVCVPPSPPKRPSGNGGLVEAFWHGSTTPVIDGQFDSFVGEWHDPLPYSANNIVFGKSNWSGASDLSATYDLKWDENYLYVAAKVEDDNYVQESSGSNLYKGDSLEILLDTDLKGDYCNTSLTSDDYQLGLSGGFLVGPGQPAQAYLWFPTSKAGEKPVVTIAAIQVSGGGFAGYQIEARIPWSVFGISPSGGEYYGFGFSVSDNDTSGTSKQQTLSSSDPKRVLTNPTTWGTLQIEVKQNP